VVQWHLCCSRYSAVRAQVGGLFDGVVDTAALFLWPGSGCGGSCCRVNVAIEGGGVADMMVIGDWCMCLCSEDEGSYYHKSPLIPHTVYQINQSINHNLL